MTDKATSTVVEHSGFDGITSEIGIKPASHDIFAKPYYVNHIQQVRYADIKFDVSDENGPFRISIPANDTEYIDLKNIIFSALLQWRDARNAVAAKNKLYAAPIPNIPNSLFDTVQIYVDNQLVASLTQNFYNYRSFVNQSLSAKDIKSKDIDNQRLLILDSPKLYETWRRFQISTAELPNFAGILPGSGTTTDTVDNETNWQKYNTAIDTFETALLKLKRAKRGLGQNSGFMDRIDYINDFQPQDNMIRFLSTTDLDFFSSDQLLPPGISIQLVFTRAKDKFVVQTKETSANIIGSKFKIHELKFNVPYVTLKPEYKQYHDNAFARGELSKRIFKRIMFHTRQFPSGINDLSWDQVVIGDIPKKIIFFMVETKAFDGDPHKSPYYFPNCKVNEIQVSVNNELFPNNPMKMDFTKLDVSEAYNWFLDNEGFKNSSESCRVTYSHWVNGLTYHSFDLRPDRCNGAHIHKKKTGQLSIKFKLDQPLTENHTMMVCAIYDMCATFGKNKSMELHII